MDGILLRLTMGEIHNIVGALIIVENMAYAENAINAVKQSNELRRKIDSQLPENCKYGFVNLEEGED